ncbi:hypothetical protein [Treponema sp.]|nr:hypothetical protein [Treponema sp.]
MDKVADTLFILEDDGSVSGFVGKCSEYLDYLDERKSAETAEKKAERKNSESVSSGTSAPQQKKKRSFKEQKEFESLESEIESLESRKAELEPLMSSADYAVSKKAGDEYSAIAARLDEAYARWEELAELG